MTDEDHAVPADPVQAQLDAYNAHDIDAFTACFAEDARVLDAAGGVLRDGREAIRAAYAERFANPALHAELVGRLRAGAWVFDQELVTGLGDAPVHAVAAYQVTDGLITVMQLFK